MGDISINISVNASFSYYGQNASQNILHGQLNSAHNSTLSGYWINYPTPWPYLLISVALSIGLGYLGFRSSAKSWRPMHKHTLLPSNDIEMLEPNVDDTDREPIEQPRIYTDKNNQGFFKGLLDQNERLGKTTKEERRAYVNDRSNNLAIDAQRAAQAEYAAAGRSFDPEDDNRPDGGVGKFSMYKTLFGVCWTTIRSISIFSLAIQIATGVSSNSYPGPLSVMILFASAQTYLAGRGMPRIFNVILAYDLLLIWIAFVLASFGPDSTVKYYGKIGIQGGNCPYFQHSSYNGRRGCAYGRWSTVGCSTNSTWDTSIHEYPRTAWWYTGNPDPNTYGNSLLTLELDFKLIGIAYGFIALFMAIPMYFLPFAPRLLLKPLPAVQMAFLRRMSYTMSMLAFALVLILSIIAVPLHISDELNPPKFTYVDSVGPLVNTSYFDSAEDPIDGENWGYGRFSALDAIDGQWPSLAWNQSHNGTAWDAPFLGGNSTSWSDCFRVQPPKSKTGHLSAWWQVDESKALRILAGL